MPTVKIPFKAPVNRNVDESALSDANSAILIDGYKDEAGNVYSRPGLASFRDLVIAGTNGIDGLYWFDALSCVMVVSNQRLWKITESAGVYTTTELSAGTMSELVLGRRVSFTDNGTYVFLCSGGKIYYTNGTAAPVVLADVDAPTSVDSVGYLDTYIIANVSGTNKFQWADVSSPLTWNALSFASASASPDSIKSLLIVEREIYLFGATTIEIWENDGSTPFSRVPGGSVQFGTSAKASPIYVEGVGIFFLDHKRRVSKLSSRQVESVSTPYDKIIQGLSSVSDCSTDLIEVDGLPLLVFHFPTAEKTLVYNYLLNDWSEWGSYEADQLAYERWVGSCHVYCPAWNKHLVGERNIARVSAISSTSADDNGHVIKLYLKTGNIAHGQSRRKRCDEVRFIVRRGDGLSSREPVMMIRYRDQGGPWSIERSISLGNAGQFTNFMRLQRLGIYQRRQWEISCTDAVKFCLSDIEEDYTPLR